MDYSTILRNKTLFNEENETLESEDVAKGSAGEAKTDPAFLDATSGKDKEEVSETPAETTSDAHKEEVSETPADKPVEGATEPANENANLMEAIKKEIEAKIGTSNLEDQKEVLSSIVAGLKTPEALEALSKDFDNIGTVREALLKNLNSNPTNSSENDDYWTANAILERYNNGLALILYFIFSKKPVTNDKIVESLVSFYNKKAEVATPTEEIAGTETVEETAESDEIQKYIDALNIIKADKADPAKYFEGLMTFATTYVDTLKDFSIIESILNKTVASKDTELVSTCKHAVYFLYLLSFVQTKPQSFTIPLLKQFIKKDKSEKEIKFITENEKDMDTFISQDSVVELIRNYGAERQDDEDMNRDLGNVQEFQNQNRETSERIGEAGYKEDWANCMIQYAKISRAASLTIEAAKKAGLVDDVVMKLCAGLGAIGGVLRVVGMFIPRPYNALVTSAASCMVYTSTTVASGKGLIKEIKKPGKKNILNILALSSGMVLSGLGLARSSTALVSNIKDTVFYNQTLELINNPEKTLTKINTEMDALEKQKQNYIASGDTDKIAEIERKQAALQEGKDVALGFQDMSPEERQNAYNSIKGHDLPSAIQAAKTNTDAAARRGEELQRAQAAQAASERLEQGINMTISEFQALPENIKANEAEAFIKAHATEGTNEANWYANALASGDPETINKAKQIRAYVNSSPKFIQEAQLRNAVQSIENIEDSKAKKEVITTVVEESANNTPIGDTDQQNKPSVSELNLDQQGLSNEDKDFVNRATLLDNQIANNKTNMDQQVALKGDIESQIESLESKGVLTADDREKLTVLNTQLNDTNRSILSLSQERTSFQTQKSALENDEAWDRLIGGNVGWNDDNFQGYNSAAGITKDMQFLDSIGFSKEQSTQFLSGMVQGLENGTIPDRAHLADYINANISDPKAQKTFLRRADRFWGEFGNEKVSFTTGKLERYVLTGTENLSSMRTDKNIVIDNLANNDNKFQTAVSGFMNGEGDFSTVQNTHANAFNAAEDDWFSRQ